MRTWSTRRPSSTPGSRAPLTRWASMSLAVSVRGASMSHSGQRASGAAQRPRECSLELHLEPVGDPDDGLDVHAGLHALALKDPGEVLGREVAGRARGEWTAPGAAD